MNSLEPKLHQWIATLLFYKFDTCHGVCISCRGLVWNFECSIKLNDIWSPWCSIQVWTDEPNWTNKTEPEPSWFQVLWRFRFWWHICQTSINQFNVIRAFPTLGPDPEHPRWPAHPIPLWGCSLLFPTMPQSYNLKIPCYRLDLKTPPNSSHAGSLPTFVRLPCAPIGMHVCTCMFLLRLPFRHLIYLLQHISALEPENPRVTQQWPLYLFTLCTLTQYACAEHLKLTPNAP